MLGDSQPLALVYFNQMVIFQLTQWFALLNWSNSSPLTTWGFLVYFRFLWTLWRKWFLCPVGEEFEYITNEDTGCRILSLNQIFHLCSGPTGAVWQFVGGFLFSFEPLDFYFGPSWTQHPLTHLVFSLHTLSCFSCDSICSLNLLILQRYPR